MARFRENGLIPKYLGNSHYLNTLVQRFQITIQFDSQIRNQQQTNKISTQTRSQEKAGQTGSLMVVETGVSEFRDILTKEMSSGFTFGSTTVLGLGWR